MLPQRPGARPEDNHIMSLFHVRMQLQLVVFSGPAPVLLFRILTFDPPAPWKGPVAGGCWVGTVSGFLVLVAGLCRGGAY